LLRWSRFIWWTIFSYQSASSDASFILRATCYSNDYFTGNRLLLPCFFLYLFPPVSSLLRCWFNWKSKKANFLWFLLLQSP
jgi:hypothetical protein